MFECDSNDESEVLMTRVIDALRGTGAEKYCSDNMDDVGHGVEETKLIELNNLIQEIKLTTATPAGVDVSSESMENGRKQKDSSSHAWHESPCNNQVVGQFEHGNSDINDKDFSGQDKLEDKKVCAMVAELSKIKEENALMKVEVVEVLSTKGKLEKELSDKNGQLSDIKETANELKERLIKLETEKGEIVEEKTDLESALKVLKEEKIDLEEKLKQLLEDSENCNKRLIELQKNNDIVETRNNKIIEEKIGFEADIKALIAEIENKMFEIGQLKKENKAKTDELDEIKAYNEALRSNMTEKEEKAKKILTNAKVKIQKIELENRELQKQLDGMKAAFEAQINFLKDAKTKEEEAKNDLVEENKMLEEELQQWIKDSHLKSEQISKLGKLNRKTKKGHEVERKVFKLEKEMKLLKRNSEDKNEQLMKLGRNFMEVLNLAENENSSNKKQHTESDHQRPSSMSNGHQSQNPHKLEGCELFVHGIDEHIQNHEMVAEFGKYGTVKEAFNTGRGYAFITYTTPADAQDCLTSANGQKVFGKTVQIKERIRNLQKKAWGAGFKGNLNSKAEKRMASGTEDYGSKVGGMDSTSTYSNFSGAAGLGGGSDIRLGEDWYELNGRYVPKKSEGEENLYSEMGKSRDEKQRMAHGTGDYGSKKSEEGDYSGFSDLTGLGGGYGTSIRFNAPSGSDMMLKEGVLTQVSVKLQSITCMKEYQNKSMEELRWEDYLSGRKRGRAPAASQQNSRDVWTAAR